MANESKKFALFACCMMTMQALRLVISTAGFCVVRFHIDSELFGIFISRLVNAVLMSQLFGNWLGDVIVFTATGPMKLYAIAAANWAELLCFSTALVCLIHSEMGHLTGFYWSMVSSYFWWKVGEAPAIGIGVDEVDWYFAGFTLSGVWAACLKGLVMLCVGHNANKAQFHSVPLGDVNVKVVGARSVKTTVDYRAAKWLYVITIVLTFLMCLVWELAAWIKTEVTEKTSELTRDWIVEELKKALKEASDEKMKADTENNLANAIRDLKQNVQATQTAVTLTNVRVADGEVTKASGGNQITIVVRGVGGSGTGNVDSGPTGQELLENKLKSVVETDLATKIQSVSGIVAGDTGNKTLTLTVTATGTTTDRDTVFNALQKAANTIVANDRNNKIAASLGALTSEKVDTTEGTGEKEATLNFGGAEVSTTSGVGTQGKNQITITVTKVASNANGDKGKINSTGTETEKLAGTVKDNLNKLIKQGEIASVTLTSAEALQQSSNTIQIISTVKKGEGTRGYIGEALKGMASDKLQNAIKNVTSLKVDTTEGATANDKTKTLDFQSARVTDSTVKAVGPTQIQFEVENVKKKEGQGSGEISKGTNTGKVQDSIKEELEKLIARGWAMSVKLSGTVPDSVSTVKLTLSVGTGGWITEKGAIAMATATAITTGAIFAVPGALTFAAFGKCCNCGLKGWVVMGGVFGFCGGAGTVGGSVLMQKTKGKDALDEMWVPWFKWGGADMKEPLPWAAVIGLRKGTLFGALVGLCIGSRKGSTLSGLLGGAFIGSFFGLWFGEIYNGYKTWQQQTAWKIHEDGGGKDKRDEKVVVCGFFIVVFGLGTVYSIYPGMAPCSITQFQYFNIIDIWILILSSIAPIVIMGVDLAEEPWRLGKTILTQVNDSEANTRMWGAVGSAVAMLIGTNICEIIVLSIMQHPHSKLAKDVTTSGWRACFLTIMMVTCQLTSTGIGFGCVAAGSGFNDGVYNALSTVTLWTTECCGVLGEGYLTELKKYEPGKWPTQGMGKWATYWWWNGKAFGNAWAIWCCIGTTDLRRDIMLCKQ